MEKTDMSKTSKQYKDTLFRTLFSDNDRFLELFNAVADSKYPDGTKVEPCPTNSLLARFNDLAACIGSQLIVFFEHQSTISKNLPLRMLEYATEILYSTVIDKDKLYGSAQVMIPAPMFFVLYNGEQKLENHVMRLSDAFLMRDSEPALELKAKVVNINYGGGEASLERSPALKGYSYLIAEIRRNLRSGMSRDNAITAAIDTCIGQGILRAFLTEYYAEVMKMLNYEYDAEAERRVLRQEGLQEGRQEGRQEGLQEGRQESRQETLQEVLEMMKKLKEGELSVDDAYARIKKASLENQ